MKHIFLIVCVVMLGGCATSPVSQSAAKPVPEERVFAFQGAPGPTDGQVLLVRDSGMLGGGCRSIIYVDDKEAAIVATSERVSLTLPLGQHLLSTGPTDRGLCGLGGAKDSLRRTVTINVKPGHTQSFRIAILGDGGANLMPTSL